MPSVARAQEITHHIAHARPGQRVRQGVFHIQNVNAYHSRLKSWIGHFHRVATRHLPNYLGWCLMLERYPQGIRLGYCIQEAVGRTMRTLLGHSLLYPLSASAAAGYAFFPREAQLAFRPVTPGAHLAALGTGTLGLGQGIQPGLPARLLQLQLGQAQPVFGAA